MTDTKHRIWRAIDALMRKDGDRCSLCRMALSNKALTYGGLTRDGVVGLVGECCVSKLDRIFP